MKRGKNIIFAVLSPLFLWRPRLLVFLCQSVLAQSLKCESAGSRGLSALVLKALGAVPVPLPTVFC